MGSGHGDGVPHPRRPPLPPWRWGHRRGGPGHRLGSAKGLRAGYDGDACGLRAGPDGQAGR